jgi:Ca-activated chloride channel family protein
MKEFNLSNPYILLLSFLVPFYIYYRIKFWKQNFLKFAPLQFHKAKSKRESLIYLSLFIESLLIILSLIGISEPYKTTERKLILDKGIDIALVLDVSASMQADDFEPNRLEAMKKMSTEFIKRTGSNRIGIYIFAQDTFTQTPLTTDQSILLELMDSISFYIIDHSISGGTAIGDALLASSEALLKSRIKDRDQAIILITDGESSYGVDPLLAAKYINSIGIKLYTIGIAGDEKVSVYVDGSPYLTPSGEILETSLNDTQLIELTKIANGKYYRAKNNRVLTEIFSELSKLSSTPLEIKTNRLKDSYSYLVARVITVLFFIWLLLEGIFLRRPLR